MTRTRIITTSPKKGGTLDELVDEIFGEIGDKACLKTDVEKYMGMDVSALPSFNEDGSVAMYEVGGVLLGKISLVRFMERLK